MEPPFVERRLQQRPVAVDRRRPPSPPPRRSRRPRGRVFAVEMSVGLLIVAALAAVALPLYSGHEKGAHDLAAKSDLRNAMYVVQVCTAISGGPPASALTVVEGMPRPACDGEAFKVSAGTVLTYLPDAGGLSFVLRAHNKGGRPAYWCWDAAMGGPIRAVADPVDSC